MTVALGSRVAIVTACLLLSLCAVRAGLVPKNPLTCNKPSGPTSCRDPSLNTLEYCVNNLKKTCGSATNYNCAHCSNFQKLATCVDAGSPGCTSSYYYTSNYGGPSTPHWLIEPTKAIIGFESIRQGYAAGSEGLWQQAWNDAVKGQIRGTGPAVAAAKLGLLMNSYGYRDQHQMHIHIGNLDQNVIPACLAGLKWKGSDKFQATTCTAGGKQFKVISYWTDSLDHVNDNIQSAVAASGWNNPTYTAGVVVTQNPVKPRVWLTNVFDSMLASGPSTHVHIGDHQIMDY